MTTWKTWPRDFAALAALVAAGDAAVVADGFALPIEEARERALAGGDFEIHAPHLGRELRSMRCSRCGPDTCHRPFCGGWVCLHCFEGDAGISGAGDLLDAIETVTFDGADPDDS